ncbi:YlaH-like family protein [Ornithinibacillus sp. 4-3]|uniref:YlaH-like family protein n=1 Tax=Ornithinibacillus sp. 4-3 TaxID=3231488 RepID=A0AB39HUK3_9BACI
MVKSFIFEFFIEQFGTNNIFWYFYIVNLILSVIAYKLGFARKLPLGKSIIVYILLAIATFISTTFSLLQFPITESLIIVSIIMGIYRLRLHRERSAKNN